LLKVHVIILLRSRYLRLRRNGHPTPDFTVFIPEIASQQYHGFLDDFSGTWTEAHRRHHKHKKLAIAGQEVLAWFQSLRATGASGQRTGRSWKLVVFSFESERVSDEETLELGKRFTELWQRNLSRGDSGNEATESGA
jgi:hypothetical protein